MILSLMNLRTFWIVAIKSFFLCCCRQVLARGGMLGLLNKVTEYGVDLLYVKSAVR